jgi:hypothetical protein
MQNKKWRVWLVSEDIHVSTDVPVCLLCMCSKAAL